MESIFSRYIFLIAWKGNFAALRFHCHRSYDFEKRIGKKKTHTHTHTKSKQFPPPKKRVRFQEGVYGTFLRLARRLLPKASHLIPHLIAHLIAHLIFCSIACGGIAAPKADLPLARAVHLSQTRATKKV